MKIGIDGLYLQAPTMGVGRYLYNLMYNLPEISDSNMQYLLLSNSSWLNKPIMHPQVSYQEIICLKILWKNYQLPLLQRKKAIDILFLPNYTAPLINLGKCIVCIHDIIPYIYPQWSSLNERVRFSFIVRQSAKNVDHIITVSETTKNDIIKYFGISENKITAIPLSVDERFKPSVTSSQNDFRLKFNLLRPYFLFVGALHPRRNIIRLIKAFKLLNNKYKNKFDLVLIGITFSERYARFIQQCLDTSALHDRIRILGFVSEDDLVKFYSFAQAFIYPSLYEGFGLPLLEAMACGTPVVSSNCSAMLEVAGPATLLFDPYDISSIYHALELIGNDQQLRIDLIKKGIERKSSYSWRRTAEETLSVIKKVLNQ
jgi:glycosyltransferase involved in cell wall biosynthesis